MTKTVRQIVFCLALLYASTTAMQVYAQGTIFTYQGQLNDGALPANGTNYGMVFYLFDAPTNGNQLGDLGIPSVTVSNGLFCTPLNFGNVFGGNPCWLQITVQKNGGPFSTLWPRQPITATPYAIMAGSASNFVGGAISLAQLPGATVTNYSTGVNLSGTFGGTITGFLLDLTNELPATLKNVYLQIATPLNLGGGTNLSGSQILGGTWTNASLAYAYKSFYTNYTITTSDVVLDCTGTNQVITLLPSAHFPPSTLLTIWSDNINGSVIITNGTGFEAITVPGQGQGLAVLLGPANSPSNSVTLMVHGGHW